MPPALAAPLLASAAVASAACTIVAAAYRRRSVWLRVIDVSWRGGFAGRAGAPAHCGARSRNAHGSSGRPRRGAAVRGVGSESNRYFGRLALLDLVDEAGRTVLPHQQHRALRAEALVAAVGGHGCHVTGLHDHARHRLAGVLVAAIPENLVGHLKEPLDAIVAVDDGQHVLLRRRAHEACLTTDVKLGFHVT